MASSFFVLADVKTLLNISDTGDDSLLNLLGALADQHIDNIMKIHDEKIPIATAALLDDLKMAANFYTISLFHAEKNSPELSDLWMKRFQEVIDGVTIERAVDSDPYMVERFGGRRFQEADIFQLWFD